MRLAVHNPSPLLSRTLAKLQMQREQRQMIKNDQKRVKEIDSKLHAIDAEKGDLLQRIVSNRLEIIEILALRNAYEKQIAASSITDTQDPFETLTKQFINQHLDEYRKQNPSAPQSDITDQKQSLTLILTEVFDLDNTDRNQLVLGFSNYSRLYTEKQALLAKY